MENIRGVPDVRVVVNDLTRTYGRVFRGFVECLRSWIARPRERTSKIIFSTQPVTKWTVERENWEFVAECDKLDKFGRKDAPERPPHAICGLLRRIGMRVSPVGRIFTTPKVFASYSN